MEKRLIYIAITLVILSSCSKQEEVVQVKYIEPISGIIAKSSFDIILHRDTATRIVLSGNSEAVNAVNILRNADTISIENTLIAKWLKPKDNKVKLDIYCDSLSRITLSETCNLSSKDSLHSDEVGIIVGSKLNIVDVKFSAKTVFYWNNFPCSGTIKFSGKTEELKIWNTALMQVDASRLVSNYVLVDNNSGEDCRVHANQYLDYNITGAGNIYVSGNPAVIASENLTGTGELILVD